MIDMVQKTNFTEQTKVVLSNGSVATIEFVAVPAAQRDPLVRVFLKTPLRTYRIGTGRLTQTETFGIISMPTGSKAIGFEVLDLETVKDCLTQVTPTLYDLYLKAVPVLEKL